MNERRPFRLDGGIPENITSPELYEVKFGGLTISGRSGTGKTHLATDLATTLGIPPERNFKVGENFRKQIAHERGEQIIDYAERDLSVDEDLDNLQRELLSNADPNQPFILEGRLAGFHASNLRDDLTVLKEELPSVVTVLLTANADTRFHRIHERQSMKDKGLSLNKVRKDTRNREKKDRKQWEQLYPELQGVDVFVPQRKDNHGRPWYDVVIDTNGKGVQEVLDELLQDLQKRGDIKRNKPMSGRMDESKEVLYPYHY